MDRNYKIAITISFILLTVAIGFTVIKRVAYDSMNKSIDDINVQVDSSVGLTTIPSDFLVDESFESHLPLVIIDIGGQSIPRAYRYNSELACMEKIEGIDPYVYGTVSVINGGAVNRLSDEPETQSRMQIRRRGNMSLGFNKRQYKIELLNDQNEKAEEDILGMGADNDWILSISMIDKSLIRNYLAYSVAKELDDTTPDAKYCEVFFKNGDEYTYEGLYFLAESIKQSPYRVDIKEYNPKSAVTSFLLRRDRYDAEALLLNNYASVNSLTYGYIEVKYPSADKIKDDAYEYIENRISSFEKCLYSDDESEFENYKKYIDMDSFVDYFLINEFFGNYDAGNNSTYIYADRNGIIHIGPVWDFDGAYDNYEDSMSPVNEIVFDQQPWFSQLVLSEEFVRRLNERYAELREGILSDERIEERIDSITGYLGNAQLRDWDRWKNDYESRELVNCEDEDRILIDRNTVTYEEEIQQIKDYLNLHADGIETRLKDKQNELQKSRYTGKYGIWMIMLLVMFFSSIVIVRRGMR